MRRLICTFVVRIWLKHFFFHDVAHIKLEFVNIPIVTGVSYRPNQSLSKNQCPAVELDIFRKLVKDNLTKQWFNDVSEVMGMMKNDRKKRSYFTFKLHTNISGQKKKKKKKIFQYAKSKH